MVYYNFVHFTRVFTTASLGFYLYHHLYPRLSPGLTIAHVSVTRYHKGNWKLLSENTATYCFASSRTSFCRAAKHLFRDRGVIYSTDTYRDVVPHAEGRRNVTQCTHQQTVWFFSMYVCINVCIMYSWMKVTYLNLQNEFIYVTYSIFSHIESTQEIQTKTRTNLFGVQFFMVLSCPRANP